MADERRARFDRTALPYLDELFRVARRVMADTTAAEDVVQDTYLRAWQAFDRFEPGTNCRAWLYTILFRTIGAHRRDLQRELALFDGEILDESRYPSPEVTDVRLDLHRLERAFAELPIAFATVIQLVDVEGLTYKEAAAALGVPVGTIMSRLHRGRRELRQRLAPPALRVAGAKERP